MVKQQNETENSEPIRLGERGRAVLEVILEATEKGECVTVKEIHEATGTPENYLQTLLRELRRQKYVVAFTPETERTQAGRKALLYSAMDSSIRPRFEVGLELQAEAAKARARIPASEAKPLGKRAFTATTMIVAAFDREINRWSGVRTRERNTIKDAGKDPNDRDAWTLYDYQVRHDELEDADPLDPSTAEEIVSHLQALRKTFVTPNLRAAQHAHDEKMFASSIAED